MYVDAARGVMMAGQTYSAQTTVPVQTASDTDIDMNSADTAVLSSSMDGDGSQSVQLQSADEQTVLQQQTTESEKLKKAMEKLTEQLPNSEAKFGIHEATNRVMITLVDKDTQEVIREIPAEKTLDMLAKSLEMAGVLVDRKL